MSVDKVPENVKQRTKDSYDAIAEKYNEWTVPHAGQKLLYLNKLIALLDESLPTSSPVSILELGCGCGQPVTEQLLSHENYHVTANDLSSSMIEMARNSLRKYEDRLNLVEGDMSALTFPDHSLDAVLGMYSVIHLPRDEQVELIGKIAKWLKPGGYFLANFSKEAAESIVMEKWLAEEGWGFWSGFGAAETLQKIKEAGFTVLVEGASSDVGDSSFLWVIAKNGTDS